jgi:hypothetical protein
MRRLSRAASTLKRTFRLMAFLVILAGAFGLAVVAFPLARYEPAEPVEPPSGFVSVVERESDLSATAQLTIGWSAGRDVYSSTETHGVVVTLAVSVGDIVNCGRPVLDIDDHVLLAYCAASPLWREITPDTVGTDVDQLMSFLAGLGDAQIADSASGPTRRERRDAIRNFQKRVGLKETDRVSPGDLLWIDQSVTASELGVHLGQTLVGGEKLISESPKVVRAAIVDWQDDGNPRVFNLDSSAARFVISSDGSLEDLDALERELGTLGLTKDGIPSSASGASRLVDPVVALAVAPSAVVSDDHGACVVVSGGGTLEVRDVEIVSSTVEAVLVRGDLGAGDQVQLNPGTSTSC